VAEHQVNIPPTTLLKMLLRGIYNISFIDEVIKVSDKMHCGDRKGIRTLDGIIVYFEKVEDTTIILSAYLVGHEDEVLDNRITALSNLLISIISK
jgi:hypothetical protein